MQCNIFSIFITVLVFVLVYDFLKFVERKRKRVALFSLNENENENGEFPKCKTLDMSMILSRTAAKKPRGKGGNIWEASYFLRNSHGGFLEDVINVTPTRKNIIVARYSLTHESFGDK